MLRRSNSRWVSFARGSTVDGSCVLQEMKGYDRAEIPNIPKITACMFKNRSSLSPGCRAVMDKDLAAQKSRKVSAAD